MTDFVIINEDDFMKARKKIKENSGKRIIFSSNDYELSRKILERFGKDSSSTSFANSQSKEKIDAFLINLSGRKDRQKQRDSGFDHVMAKLAKKNNIVIGINLDEIINSKGKTKAEILGRIRQNIKLLNKNKLNAEFIHKEDRDVYDLKALGLVLGMPTWMTNQIR